MLMADFKNPIMTLPFKEFAAGATATQQQTYIKHLEHGGVLFLPNLGFHLLPEEKRFLSPEWSDAIVIAKPLPLPLRIIFVHSHINVGNVVLFEIGLQLFEGLVRDLMIASFSVQSQDTKRQTHDVAHPIKCLIWSAVSDDDRLQRNSVGFAGMKLAVLIRGTGTSTTP